MGNGDGGGVLAVPLATPASMGGLATAMAVSGRFLGPDLLALSSHGGHHLFINRIPPRLPKEDVEKIILSQLRLHPFVLQVSKCSVIPQNSLKNKGYGFITLDGSPTPDDLDAIANSLNNKLQVGCRTLGVRVCTDCHNALLAEDDVGAFSSSPGSSPPNEPGGCDMQEAHGRAIINAQSAGADDRLCGPAADAILAAACPASAVPLQSSLLQSAAAELARQTGSGASARRRKASKQQHEQGALAEPGPRHPHHQQQHHQQEHGHHQPHQQSGSHSHHSKHRHEHNQQFLEAGRGRPSRVQRPQGGAHTGERERVRPRPCPEAVYTPRPEDPRATVAKADRDEVGLGGGPVPAAACPIAVAESSSVQEAAAVTAGAVQHQQQQRPQARAVQLQLDAVVPNRHGQATGSASSPRSVSSSGSCSGFGSGPASASGFVSVGSGGCSTSGPASVSGSGLGQVLESGLVCSLSSGALECREVPTPPAPTSAYGQSEAEEDTAKVARAAVTSPPQQPAAAAAMAAGGWVGDTACLPAPASAHAAGESSAGILSPAGVMHQGSRNQATGAHQHPQQHHQEHHQQQQQLHQQTQRPHMRHQQQQQLPLSRGGSGGSAGHDGRGRKAALGLAVPSTAPYPLPQPAAAQPLPGPPLPTPMTATAAAASHQSPPPQLRPSHHPLAVQPTTVQARNARSTSHGVYGGTAAGGTCAANGQHARGGRASTTAHDRNGPVHQQRSQPPPQPQQPTPQQPSPPQQQHHHHHHQQSKQQLQQQGLSGSPHQAHRQQQTGGQGPFWESHANAPVSASASATIRHHHQQFPSQQQQPPPPQQQQPQFRPGCGRAGDVGGMAAYGRGRQASQTQDFEQGPFGARHHQRGPMSGWVGGVGSCGGGGGAAAPEDVSTGRVAVSAPPGPQAHVNLQPPQQQHQLLHRPPQQLQLQHGQGGHRLAIGAQQPQQAFVQPAHPRVLFQPVATANGVQRPQQQPQQHQQHQQHQQQQQHQQHQQQQQHSHGGRQSQHRQHHPHPHQHQQQYQRQGFVQPPGVPRAGAGAGGGGGAAAPGGPPSLATSPTSNAALLQLQLLLSSSGPRSEAARMGSPSLHTLSAPPGLGSSWRAASLDLDLDVHRSRLEATAADPLALGPIGSIQSQLQIQMQGPAPPGAGRVAASVEPLLLARGSSDGLVDLDPAEADALDSTELNPLHLEPMILQLLENDDEDDAAAAHGSMSLKGYTRPEVSGQHRGAHQGFGCHPASSNHCQPAPQQQQQPKQHVLASLGCGSEVSLSLSPPPCGSAGGISGLDAWGLMRSKSVSSGGGGGGGGGAGVGPGAGNSALAGATGASSMCGVAAAAVAAWSLAPAGPDPVPVPARSWMTEEREERARGGARGGGVSGVGVGGGFRTVGVHQARMSLGAGGGGGGDGGHFGPPGLLAMSLPNANLLMMMQRFQT